MMMFLKEASAQDEKQKGPSLRSSNFRKLATRVFQHMQYELEDIEALLNIKYQRKMLNALLENDPGVHTWLMNYRWSLRLLKHAAPFSSLTHHRPTLLSDKEFDEARLYLSQWLEDPHSTLKTPSLCFRAHFEIAEYLFSIDAYSEAQNHFNSAQALRDANPSLLEDMDRASSFTSVPGRTFPYSDASLALSNLSRSILSLSEVNFKIEAFQKVIAAILSGQSNSALTALDKLLHTLDTDKSNASNTFSAICQFLEEDNVKHELALETRLQLQQRPSIEPVRQKILALNLMWRLQHTKADPSVLWLNGIEISSQTVLQVQGYWVHFGRPGPPHKRFCDLMVIICRHIGDDQVWTMLENGVSNFEIQKRRSCALLASSVSDSLSKLASNTQSDTLRGDFHVLTSSEEVEGLKVASGAILAEHGVDLVSSILWARSQKYEANGMYEHAMNIYRVMETLKEIDSGPTLFWARFVGSLHLNAQYHESQTFQDDLKTAIQSQWFPNEGQMERLVAILLNRAKNAILPSLGLLMEATTTPACPRHVKSTLSLYHTIWKLHVTAERLHPAETSQNISVAFSEAAKSFDDILLLETENSDMVNGVLSRLKNPTILATLASHFLISLVFIYNTARIPCEAIHVDRISKSMAAVSLESRHAWMSAVTRVALSEEETLLKLTNLVLSQLLRESPQNANAAFALGDLYLHKSQYGTAMRYYLLAGATQHFSFVAPNADFLALLPAFIHCLLEAKLYHFAIILHQYAPNVDYHHALPLCTTWGHIFPSELIPFLFDISLMEALVYANKRHDSLGKAQLIVDMIAKPEQALDRNQRVLELQAYKFFQLLVRQFLDSGHWQGGY
jgi:tetratricopeptide (TPR) repeat protein